MPRAMPTLSLTLLLSTLEVYMVPAAPLPGSWIGSYQVGAQRQPLFVQVDQDQNPLRITVDLPFERRVGLTAGDAVLEGSTLSFPSPRKRARSALKARKPIRPSPAGFTAATNRGSSAWWKR